MWSSMCHSLYGPVLVGIGDLGEREEADIDLVHVRTPLFMWRTLGRPCQPAPVPTHPFHDVVVAGVFNARQARVLEGETSLSISIEAALGACSTTPASTSAT